jgi:hypothetical protein
MIITIQFEVAATDEPGRYTWQEAVDHLVKKGDGWRFPTKKEMGLMYQQRADIGGFEPDGYWASSEYNTDNTVYQFFSDGDHYHCYYFKHDGFRVRAVRDVPGKTQGERHDCVYR